MGNVKRGVIRMRERGGVLHLPRLRSCRRFCSFRLSLSRASRKVRPLQEGKVLRRGGGALGRKGELARSVDVYAVLGWCYLNTGSRRWPST